MVATTLLAWALPGPGAPGGWLHPELLTKAGVAAVFFLHGVGLSFAALRAGTMRWPLHLVVQGTTFLLFPLLGLALLALLGDGVPAELRLGLFFLCALPSTVSSSVAFTAAARGNVAGAVFNATLSSVIGVALTPLWMAAVWDAMGEPPALGPVVVDLVLWLIVPLVAGQLARPLLGRWVERHRKAVATVDRVAILLMVYTSFCASFAADVWAQQGAAQVLLVLAIAAALFALALGFTNVAARALRFPHEDRVAAVFCGSKKTLAAGVPMAKVLFAGHPGLGVILLPIMVYHPLQLLVCGVLAERWGRRAPVADPCIEAPEKPASSAGPGGAT
ncbi:MAG: bile acid:sodium symporter [Myxococcales bacterium]|nr:bile acid:sodium symporter [Myxococcales bacterium]MCB9737262.1 bile acid:sodium symporter [Deltaproteobacteria bacterium]